MKSYYIKSNIFLKFAVLNRETKFSHKTNKTNLLMFYVNYQSWLEQCLHI